MNDLFIGTQRRTALHEPALSNDAAENTLEINGLQQVAAEEPKVQDTVSTRIEDFTISVQQVRDHLKSKGLSKSKDTIQRWCRAGDLDCKKLGVLGRYFTTEASLLKLEEKLLPDMIADGVGAHADASDPVQAHTTADDLEVQVHEDAKTAFDANTPLHAGEDAPASGGMKQTTQGNAAAFSGAPENAGGQSAEVAALQAQVVGLANQLEQAQETNQFLREEIVSSRGQRGDVVEISKQMLGTLETIATGGRLDKPSAPQQPTDPDVVRYQQVSQEESAV